MPSPPLSSLWATAAPIQHIGLCGIGYGPTSRTRSLSELRFISFVGCNSSTFRSRSRGVVVLEVQRRTLLGIKNIGTYIYVRIQHRLWRFCLLLGLVCLLACLPACSGKAYQVVPYVMFNCLQAGSLYEGIPHEDSHDVQVA